VSALRAAYKSLEECRSSENSSATMYYFTFWKKKKKKRQNKRKKQTPNILKACLPEVTWKFRFRPPFADDRRL